MKKAISKKTKIASDEMRPRYDFSDGVRGKYARRLRENGCMIRVVHEDGTVTEKRVPGEMVIVLEPDVWEHFPNSQAVNHALRTLISLVSGNPQAAVKKTRNIGKQGLLSGD
jgi:hypothetical protein